MLSRLPDTIITIPKCRAELHFRPHNKSIMDHHRPRPLATGVGG